MKVPAVNFNNMTGNRYRIARSSVDRSEDNSNANNLINEIPNIPYVYPLAFGSEVAGQSKLRRLFAYGLPCMYSGVVMIDPKLLTRWQNSNLQSRPAEDFFRAIEPYRDSFGGMEAQALNLLAERSSIHPERNIKELLEEVDPMFKRSLRKAQTPIFRELTELAKALPPEQKSKFDELMEITDRKLNERPIIIPFSSYEFKYKLQKINQVIQSSADPKAKKVMKKLIKESQRFMTSTNPTTIDTQQRVLKLMDVIVKKSVLKDNVQLNELIEVSKSRLVREEVVVPFSRKQFLYDMMKVLDSLPDEELREKMFRVAEKLPTSSENFAAYIVKLASTPSEKLIHTIVWPYLASVEHLKPKSEGGDRQNMANLGAARTVLNSERKSRDLKLWIEEHPETKVNCQKYVNRLIDLKHKGVFAKVGIDPKYIEDFKDTIYELSGHTLELDISRL